MSKPLNWKRGLGLSLLFGCLSASTGWASDRVFGLPEPLSNIADEGYVDWSYQFSVNIIATFFFIAVIAVMLFLAVKYRRRNHKKLGPYSTHNTLLEVTWSMPPLIIVMYMFYIGYVGTVYNSTPPGSVYQIEVRASKWNWQFIHPNGYADSVLHLPAGEPIRLDMQSADVIHSLFVPVFRVKKDVIPGRITKLWFVTDQTTPHADDPAPEGAASSVRAVRAGHRLACTEFCGTDHSLMQTRVVVHQADWRPPKPKVTPKSLFTRNGCAACHALPGEPDNKPGPSFASGLLGKQEKLLNGSTVTIDRDYLIESIKKPGAKIADVAPKPQIQMPLVPMSDQELEAIVDYLVSLGEYKE